MDRFSPVCLLWPVACISLASAQAPAGKSAAADALFQDMPVVEAAALHTQTLEDAPANVSVITASEIRTYGYRTLGEALSSIRGFYFVTDQVYEYAGVRGLNPPGDFNTRFLVMINGHPMTEIVYGSNAFFGQDFGLDMDLVERIEIIRGATSALYGSNGILTNINIVTRSPVDHPRVQMSVENDSGGHRKGILSGSADLGRGANLLVSLSWIDGGGESFYFSDYDRPESRNGRSTRRSDRERGFHGFANLLWRDWNVVVYLNNREKHIPVPWSADGVFADPDTRISDSRDFISGTWSRDVGAESKLRWQVSFDHYRYADFVGYGEREATSHASDRAFGDWASTQLTYRFPVKRWGYLTGGVFGTVEFRNRQYSDMLDPEPARLMDVQAADRVGAVFGQWERDLGKRWKASAGIRLDQSHRYGRALSPRASLVFQPSSADSMKFVFGRPFRNPTPYEQHYEDCGLAFLRSVKLRPETAQTVEVAIEHKFRPAVLGVVNVYHYGISDLIQAAVVDGLYQFQNLSSVKSRGVEAELGGRIGRAADVQVSVARQAASERAHGWMENSPKWIWKARAARSFARDRTGVSAQYQGLSSRMTLSGGMTKPVHLLDLTTNWRFFRDFDLIAGLRNATSYEYTHPVAIAVDQAPAPGRTFFFKLVWRSRE
ncbi:MAG: TonB-dependent receptor [Acidobacteria bacterium]|nr:TonB-dependent receptor [Acidobacteriota bacterium]